MPVLRYFPSKIDQQCIFNLNMIIPIPFLSIFVQPCPSELNRLISCHNVEMVRRYHYTHRFWTISLGDTFGFFVQMHLTRVDGFVPNDWKYNIATVHGEVIRSFFLHGGTSHAKSSFRIICPMEKWWKSNFWVFFLRKAKKKWPRVEGLCAKKLKSLGETWYTIYNICTHTYIYILIQ